MQGAVMVTMTMLLLLLLLLLILLLMLLLLTTYVCQCFTTASVESMMVPSMSKRKPSKATRCGGAEYDMLRALESCQQSLKLNQSTGQHFGRVTRGQADCMCYANLFLDRVLDDRLTDLSVFAVNVLVWFRHEGESELVNKEAGMTLSEKNGLCRGLRVW